MPVQPEEAGPAEVRDPNLADSGRRRIEWAFQSMPVLQGVRKQFIKGQPLADVRVVVSLPVTAEAANLMIVLRDGGASAVLCASHARNVREDVAASLERDYSIPVIAAGCEESALGQPPQLLMDSGACLLRGLYEKRPDLVDGLLGVTEATEAGLERVHAMLEEGVLRHPVMAVGASATERLVDARFGAGRDVVDAIARACNLLLAGLNVVVAGYGRCGRGAARRARELGAQVIVTEVDPVKALAAVMDGCRVMSMNEAAGIGDVFIAAAAARAVIAKEHFEKLKNGAILCNAGHSNLQIDLEVLGRMASSKRPARESVEEYSLRDGRRVYLAGEGRVINLGAAEGQPAAAMDLSFACQALAVDHLVKNHATLGAGCHPIPGDIDKWIARTKLEFMGAKIDRLPPERERYQASRPEGI